MSLSAKVLRWSVGLFSVNAILVLIVSGLTRAGDDQQQSTDKPDVVIPNATIDPPSLPLTGDANNLPSSGNQSTTGAAGDAKTPDLTTIKPGLGASEDQSNPGGSNTAAGNMVLGEILNAIRSGDKSLDVPPLNYPPLADANASGIGGNTDGAARAHGSTLNLKLIGKRMTSIKQLSLAADALISEAQVLSGEGRVAEANALLSHAETMRSIIANLASRPAAIDQPQPPMPMLPSNLPTLPPGSRLEPAF